MRGRTLVRHGTWRPTSFIPVVSFLFGMQRYLGPNNDSPLARQRDAGGFEPALSALVAVRYVAWTLSHMLSSLFLSCPL